MSTVAELYAAIKNARRRPRGLAVSMELWAMLKKAGVVEMKTGYACGIFTTDVKFPVFQSTIVVFVNPALDGEGTAFLLTSDHNDPRVGSQERRKKPDRRQGPRRAQEQKVNPEESSSSEISSAVTRKPI